MALITGINEVLHRIRVKLYPNYLPQIEGAYIARTDNEAALSVEQVCAALRDRGGYTGNFDDLVEHVKEFMDETAYQLCDGFAVNTGYYSIHPNVGGTFNSVKEERDARKHPVTFHFRSRAPLRALAERIKIEIEGLADTQGYIAEFIDVTTDAVNETATPGGIFTVRGDRIKVAGDKPGVGVYFVSAADPSERINVAGHLAENSASKLIGPIPPLSAGEWKIEVITQYTRGTDLKEPRTIESPFTLITAVVQP
jgi:hypothetical protein